MPTFSQFTIRKDADLCWDGAHSKVGPGRMSDMFCHQKVERSLDFACALSLSFSGGYLAIVMATMNTVDSLSLRAGGGVPRAKYTTC